MKAVSAYEDDKLIGEITRQVVKDHGDILQFHKGDDQEAHVDWLLSVYDFPTNAIVCDVGCGVGGVSRRMAEKRPDLKWVLLNRSAEQLEMCPDIGEKIHSDMHRLPENIDVIMVNYALGHSDIYEFAKACAKTRATSVVIYEPIISGTIIRYDLEVELQYVFRPFSWIKTSFERAGFSSCGFVKSPHTESKSADAYGIDLLGIRSVIMMFKRPGEGK